MQSRIPKAEMEINDLFTALMEVVELVEGGGSAGIICLLLFS